MMRTMAKSNGHAAVVPSPSFTLAGDALAEWRILAERLRGANERLGAADYSVAVAEMARAQARQEVQREAAELERLTVREAGRMGIELKQPGWRFDPATVTFVQVPP